MKLRKCSREEFVSAISTDPADKFAKTFVAKADMQEQWDECWGAFSDDDELMAAIITTLSKRVPRVANLQLLHTFAKHRGKGAARVLCEDSLRQMKKRGAAFIEFHQNLNLLGSMKRLVSSFGVNRSLVAN